MVKYLEKEKNDYFKNINLNWDSNDLTINFVKEGWVTESYIALKSYFNEIKIESVFLVFKEDNITYKERLDKKKLEIINYKSYIQWISDKNLRILEGSDNYEVKNIESLELRTKNGEGLFPTVLGCEKIIETIEWEISIS